MNLPTNQIICGDARAVLATLPAGSVNCCISSPPYWALRDYGVAGQLGLEPTFEEYINKLCDIYDEVWRVLRDDGTCWVNLADTYSSGIKGSGGCNWDKLKTHGTENYMAFDPVKIQTGLPDKCLCLIPQRFVIEMVNRGWILRNTIIWHKPNPMPSSAKDRFTVDFENVFFFTKNKRYWFEPQYEPKLNPADDIRRITKAAQYKTQSDKGVAKVDNWKLNLERAALGRNKRTVWTIPTQPYPEAHFATFPEKLVEPMIKAGCPEFICTKCGKARVKIIEATGGTIGQDWNQHNIEHPNGRDPNKTQKVISAASNGTYKKTFKGYTDCGCNADWRPAVVLDPFTGAGTTLLVAAQLRRNYIGIELKQEYIDMAERRLLLPEQGLTKEDVRAGQLSLLIKNRG